MRRFIFFAILWSSSALLHAQAEFTQLLPAHFRFVAYGDTRFTDDSVHPGASDPEVRREIVRAIDQEKPAFISIGGDISFIGADPDDWRVYNAETSAWKQHDLTVYPALGNHEFNGGEAAGLANYFVTFPGIRPNRYYSVMAANVLALTLDSSYDETTGPQGVWLRHKLETVPANVDFVCLVMHHPPYTNSSELIWGGGHSSRSRERTLAKLLEQKQAGLRARIIVFAGHVHNYEHSIHNGVQYFTTGGGGAKPYAVHRRADDLFTGAGPNYHYLLVDVNGSTMHITMRRVEFENGKPIWTEPDHVTIQAPH